MKTKKMIRSIATLLTIFGTSILAYTANAQNAARTQNTQHAVIQVIDFHSTHRCTTCRAIESQTKAVLYKYYKTEMKNGTMTFQVINVDDKENYKIAEEFSAFGTALFINILKNGTSTKINLTDFAFLTATNEDNAFENGLKKELDKAVDLL